MPVIAWAEIDLEINGVNDDVAENIRLHLSRWEQLPADNVADIRERTRKAVFNGLHALGYYNANVEYELDGDTLILNIEPGVAVTWGPATVALENAEPPPPQLLQQMVQDHPFDDGERINHQRYESFKRELITTAQQLGYLDAKLKQQQFTIDLKTHRATVELIADVGPRYQIESVNFSGSGTSRELLERIAEVPVGDWYSADTVGDVYNRLLNSGYFASVNIDVDKQEAATTALNIQLRDLPKYRLTTGIGAASDVGPFIKIKGRRPRLNERGDSFEANLRWSEPEQELTTRYRIPWPDPQDRYVTWDSGIRRNQTEDTDARVFTTGLAYHRVLDSGWQYSYHIDLDREIDQVEGMEEEEQTFVLPGLSLSRRRFQGDAADPDSGYKFSVNYVTSSTKLNSDTNFQRIKGSINGVYTWRSIHSVLARFEIGAISADDFAGVPISQRFFTGGDQSIRGYEYQSISPEEDGVETGGQYLNVGSVEYRYQWSNDWEAALFVDSGRAYNDDSEPVRTSAGIGVRWKTPVGFIALDVAAPINETDEDVDSARLHFYISTPL